jgi:cell wall-associated NlpC family hydrolase
LTAILPAFLGLFSVVAICGVVVVAVLAVIYHSPFAIFFPLPDSGTEDPRTVLVSYYQEFNEKIFGLEEDGETVVYKNSEEGVPVSNFNDTLMVYMLLYGDGQAGYVMDDEGKKNLKKVFDEMNYIDAESSEVEMEVGDSLGDVWVTAYCACSICCGPNGNGTTASGKVAKAKHTIAVDAFNPIVPMGTKVVIEGTVYTVEDTGNLNHYGNDFDIFYATHEQTSQWGRQKVEAFIAEGNTNTVTVKSSSTTVNNLTYEDYMAGHTLGDDQIEVLKALMETDSSAIYASGTIGAQVAQLAMTKVGCRYSQELRMSEGYYDCSSLVYRLYKEAGLELSSTSSALGEDCYKKAQIINKEDLQPGDLIFYSYEENGMFRNISHVAIYVGDGKMVHAANPGRGVVLDPLRTGSVVFYARPYS